MKKTFKVILVLFVVLAIIAGGVFYFQRPWVKKILGTSDSAQLENVTAEFRYRDERDVADSTAAVPTLPQDVDAAHTLDVPVAAQLDLPPAATWTDDDLRDLARSHRAVSNRFTGFTAEDFSIMKEANPNLLTFQYLNLASGHFVVSLEDMQNNPDIVIKKADGTPQKGLLSASDKSYVLDPGSAEWRTLFTDRAVKAVTEGGADGIMADQGVFVNHLCDCFEGINPRTGKTYTDAEWRDDMYGFLSQVNDALGDKLLIVNSIVNGPLFYAEGADRFNDVVDGYLAEGWRGRVFWKTDKYPTVDQWRENVRLLTDLQEQEKYIVAIGKYPLTIITSEEDYQQHSLFTFASFMMGLGPKSAFSAGKFDEKNPLDPVIAYPDYWLTDVGSPLAAYYEKDNVAQRDFERAKILVNPIKQSQTVDLEGTYKTLDGETVTSVTMPAHTGLILTK